MKFAFGLIFALTLSVAATLAAQSGVTGTLTLNTPAPVAGGVAEFIATIEGVDLVKGVVGNVDMQCYQGSTLVLEYPQFTLFYNTSYLGSPYVIDFTLYFSGAATCEAHLWSYRLSGSNKPPKRTKANTITTVSFLVNP